MSVVPTNSAELGARTQLLRLYKKVSPKACCGQLKESRSFEDKPYFVAWSLYGARTIVTSPRRTAAVDTAYIYNSSRGTYNVQTGATLLTLAGLLFGLLYIKYATARHVLGSVYTDVRQHSMRILTQETTVHCASMTMLGCDRIINVSVGSRYGQSQTF